MKCILFILYATTAFSAVIPIYPEFADRPDSAQVKSARTNQISYTVKYSYNSEGYLTSEKYYENGLQTGSAECYFQKAGDTVKCTYTISGEPANQYVDMYIFDNSGKVVRYKGYDGSYLYDDEIIAYNQDNKISKMITASAPLASEIGDSTVYRYQNNRITTVDIYGDRGTKWAYSAYETDNVGRVIRSTEYSCENSCVADSEYMVYFYGNSSVRHESLKNAQLKSCKVSVSNDNVLVRMQNGNFILDIEVFDLNGKCIKKVSSVAKNSIQFSTAGIKGREVILQLHTSKGVYCVPVLISQ